MELVKQNENIVKDYSTDVNGIETINNISFQIKDSDKVVGTASVSASGLNISMYGIYGKTILEIEDMLKAMLAK